MSEWRKIPGFDYEINKQTQVRNTKTGYILKHHENWRGYLYVSLSKKGKHHVRTIHYLMMLTFVGQRPEGMDVRHLDGNKKNNSLDNLAYGTRKENIHDGFKHGTINMGEKHGMTRLKTAQVKYIKSHYKKRHPEFNAFALARKFGVAPTTVRDVITGRTWKHV